MAASYSVTEIVVLVEALQAKLQADGSLTNIQKARLGGLLSFYLDVTKNLIAEINVTTGDSFTPGE